MQPPLIRSIITAKPWTHKLHFTSQQPISHLFTPPYTHNHENILHSSLKNKYSSEDTKEAGTKLDLVNGSVGLFPTQTTREQWVKKKKDFHVMHEARKHVSPHQ